MPTRSSSSIAFARASSLRLLAHLHRRQRDVLQNRLVREQVERLEHHADVGAQLRQLAALVGQHLTVDRDGAGVDGLEPIDGAAQRRLARSRRPEHHDHLTAVDVEVDVLEHVQAAEVLVDRLASRSSARRCGVGSLVAVASDPSVSMRCRPYPGNAQLAGLANPLEFGVRSDRRTIGP